MNRGRWVAHLCFLILLLSPLSVGAYDSDIVHPAINEKAARQMTDLVNVMARLGFNQGLDSLVQNKEIFKWLREGGTREDETVCRSRSHFHDPFKEWGSAGLNNPAVNAFCAAKWENFSADSSVVWAQKKQMSPSSQNNWSWSKAREYYHQAMTIRNDTSRQDYFANTFRSLGQVMHLVADLSVPAHVRNDIHVFPLTIPFIGVEVGGQTYESWAQRNSTRLNYTARHVPASIFGQALVSDLAKVPISALWIQGKYVGTNPEITRSTNTSPVGLAEYTNANFFSEDTIFRDYPHPARENTSAWLVEQAAKDGITEMVMYVQGYTSQRLAAYSYFAEFEDQIPEKQWLYNLDDFVYEDYASQLVPRAVGYSAGLLNYFFRGMIEITAPSSYVYSIADGSQVPYVDVSGNRHQQFTRIKAKLRNTTVSERDLGGNPTNYEPMQAGVLHAVARYRVIPNYHQYLSSSPPGDLTMRDVTYSYSVSAPISVTSLSSLEATEFAFDFSGSPIPAGISDLILQVVFKGTLGGEEDIAVAVGMKDLSEPTHHLFWNLTDMFSLNGHLYSADTIRDTPTLAYEVDFNHNGTLSEPGEPYIHPHEESFEISYMAEGGQQAPQVAARAESLQGGRHVRLIVLTDRAAGNALRLAWTASAGQGPGAVDFSFQGVTNQVSGGVLQTSLPASSFRGVKHHFSQGVLNCYPTSVADRCTYPESEALAGDPVPVQARILFQ